MLTFCARSAYCLVVAFLFRSLLPSVHAEIKPLQPLDIFEFEYAGDPTISPNGRQIVYVRHFSDIMTDLRYTNLWLINADGTGHRALTTGHHHDGSRNGRQTDPACFTFPAGRDQPSSTFGGWIRERWRR